MAGTHAGGIKAAAKNKEKWGADFYARIGARGGHVSTTGGFFANRELARRAGRKGGAISSRAEFKPTIEERRKKYLERSEHDD